MAVSVMSTVWDNFSGNEDEKIVLLALADACNDGGVIVLDEALIARKCSLSIGEIQKTLARLIAGSWLVCEGDIPGGFMRYRIALDRFPKAAINRGMK